MENTPLAMLHSKKTCFCKLLLTWGKEKSAYNTLPVDGYSEQENTVYKFLGCIFHSCDRCNTNRNVDGILELILKKFYTKTFGREQKLKEKS